MRSSGKYIPLSHRMSHPWWRAVQLRDWGSRGLRWTKRPTSWTRDYA